MNTTLAVIQDAISQQQNIDENDNISSNDENNHTSFNMIVMIIIAVCAVIFIWIVVIGCYWTPLQIIEEQQDNDNEENKTEQRKRSDGVIQTNIKYNISNQMLSSSLLINNHNPTRINSDFKGIFINM